jgi:hypothetical protein
MTVGTATLAMVDESTIEMAPAMPAIVTSHLLVGDAARVDNGEWPLVDVRPVDWAGGLPPHGTTRVCSRF